MAGLSSASFDWEEEEGKDLCSEALSPWWQLRKGGGTVMKKP